MGKNNFGLRSRDAAKAAAFALRAAAARGEISHATAAAVAQRFAASWPDLRASYGVRWLEDLSREAVVAYGQELAARVRRGELAAATAQNRISAVNRTMRLATGGRWTPISPTRDCHIPHRSGIRAEAPGALDREAYARALAAVEAAQGPRAAAVVALARELGLRSREGSTIDARSALREARERGIVTVTNGTKGGRPRSVTITNERQVEALARAAAAQGSDRSLIPASQSWAQWRAGPLRAAREAVQAATGGGLHDLRAAYACERYEALTGSQAPVAGGARALDRSAQLTIAEELGHGRVTVTREYLG